MDKLTKKQETLLEALRRAKGWTQTELAEKSGVDQSTISRLEGLQRSIGPHLAQKFGEALGVDATDLRVGQIAQLYAPE